MAKVEALEDDSIFIETSTGKKYYLKIKGAKRPGVEAWNWATHLCQFSQLLGNELSGYVAEVAYGSRGDLGRYQPPPVGIIPSKARVATASAAGPGSARPAAIPEDGTLPTGGAYSPLGSTPTRSPGSTMPKAMGGLSGDSPADSTETDEGEETAEEAQRRQQWIEYYVSIGQYKEAEEIGWDLQYPPDPRQAAGGAEPGPLYAANYAGAAPAKEKKGGGLFGRGKKAEVHAAPQPDTPKGSQMQWLEAGVDAGLKTPSSGTGTGLQTPANAEAGSR